MFGEILCNGFLLLSLSVHTAVSQKRTHHINDYKRINYCEVLSLMMMMMMIKDHGACDLRVDCKLEHYWTIWKAASGASQERNVKIEARSEIMKRLWEVNWVKEGKTMPWGAERNRTRHRKLQWRKASSEDVTFNSVAIINSFTVLNKCVTRVKPCSSRIPWRIRARCFNEAKISVYQTAGF